MGKSGNGDLPSNRTNGTNKPTFAAKGGRSAGLQPALDVLISNTVGNTGPCTTKGRFKPVTDRRSGRTWPVWSGNGLR